MTWGPPLDSPTLLFALAIFALHMALVAIGTVPAMPERRAALMNWAAAMATAGAACLLFYLREDLPTALGSGLSYLAVLTVPVLGCRAHALALDCPAPTARLLTLTALGCCGVAGAQWGWWPRLGQVFAVSAAMAATLALTARMCLIGRGGTPSAAQRAAGLVAGAMASLYGARAVSTCFGFGAVAVADPSDPAKASAPAHFGALFVGATYLLSSSAAYFALVHERHRQATLERARRDGLTGVYTRLAFFELAPGRLRETQGRGYAVVMVDLDHFKSINDRHGHAGGDVALAHAARRIGNAVRISDLVGRYGGEEFCVLLPACDEPRAAALARELVEDARAQSVRLQDGQTIGYSLSAGYAWSDGQDGGAALDDVIAQADQALYMAKARGRDQAASLVSERHPRAAIA